MHHLLGAPDPAVSGKIQLSTDGAVHMAVVTHNDTGLSGQIFQPFHCDLGVEKPDQPPDDSVANIRNVVFSLLHSNFSSGGIAATLFIIAQNVKMYIRLSLKIVLRIFLFAAACFHRPGVIHYGYATDCTSQQKEDNYNENKC
jgi:hypothetical protein